MWFIFISARRFCARTAFPSSLAAWTGTWSFRREPPNSTGGTCTHELPHPSRAAAERHVYSATNLKPTKLRRSGMAALTNASHW
jgi:hypothetical protein